MLYVLALSVFRAGRTQPQIEWLNLRHLIEMAIAAKYPLLEESFSKHENCSTTLNTFDIFYDGNLST